jgi:hypothetical protein
VLICLFRAGKISTATEHLSKVEINVRLHWIQPGSRLERPDCRHDAAPLSICNTEHLENHIVVTLILCYRFEHSDGLIDLLIEQQLFRIPNFRTLFVSVERDVMEYLVRLVV